MNEIMNEVERKLRVGDLELELRSIYPYRYDYGKGREVLRLEVDADKHNFSEILKLKDNRTDMEHIEGGVLKNVYQGYYTDFSCQYSNSTYSVEITRCGDLEAKIRDLEKQVTDAQIALTEMYEGMV